MFRINLEENVPYETKLIAKGYKYPVKITRKKKSLWLSFGFNRTLLDEVRAMEGAKWHGFDDNNPVKMWSVTDSFANWFRIAYLEGKNPYAWWDQSLKEYIPSGRPVRSHQIDLIRQGYTYRYTILAAEMGTGKTLAAIEIMEMIGVSNCIWVGPRSALISVKLEFAKWKSKITPIFYTYEGLRKLDLTDVPQVVVFDEASRLKTPTSQRSQAAVALADGIREKYGWEGAVIEMSGTPAPKSPADWWNLCRVAAPGFLRECTYRKFQERLALIKQETNAIGYNYPELVSWRDSEDKCHVCGLHKNDPDHDPIMQVEEGWHEFMPSVNEVEKLYRRMKGLVLVKMKKDCLDLPEKQYKIIECKPNQEVINASKLITANTSTAIKTLILLRELSDGFQYEEEAIGKEKCPTCQGYRTLLQWDYIGPNDLLEGVEGETRELQELYKRGHEAYSQPIYTQYPDLYGEVQLPCPNCSGEGEVDTYRRTAAQVPCPKEDVLKDILDEYDDVGRIVIYAGFTGSVDRCCEIATKMQWDYIRVDGRGWHSTLGKLKSEELVQLFQNSDHKRIAFIGQAGAAGLGLNLTAACCIVYYSNDFNAESRQQSEDRIHRLGMDYNKGATIIDIVHLPTDKLILDNLAKKRELQSMTMGEISSLINKEQ